MKGCTELTAGLIKDILRVSGSKLRVLEVSGTGISGIGFQDQVNSLPLLEELKMGRCYNLIDEGIKEILKVSGFKLRVLGIESSRPHLSLYWRN